MLDPVPPPAAGLFHAVKPFSEALSAITLPYHIHEVLFTLLFYQFVQTIASPAFSNYAFPRIYPNLNRRTKVNWDVHMVSMVQSCLINTLALWVLFTDEERKGMSQLERVYGYTGSCGMIQGLAAGYFLWDLIVCTRNIAVFGLGLWAHAVSALVVFSFGFVSLELAIQDPSWAILLQVRCLTVALQRPFLNFYAPTFILYELSSPFLNVHWFCDKLNLTGSRLQWYNGMILLASFFSCRLVWGTYQSIRVYQDVWVALHLNTTAEGLLDVATVFDHGTTTVSPIFVPRDGILCMGDMACVAAQTEIMKFVGPRTHAVPVWLSATYLVSNVVLNSLNFYWFGKMIETVRKRFDGTTMPNDPSEKQRRLSIALDAADMLENYESRNEAVVPGDASTTGLDGPASVRKR